MRTIDADHVKSMLHEYLKREQAYIDIGNNKTIAIGHSNGLWEAIAQIDEEPTVEPQRMRGKGRWNAYYHGEENGKSIFSYSCNQCGYGAPYNFIGGVCEQKKWNFCPNCGANMREEQEC